MATGIQDQLLDHRMGVGGAGNHRCHIPIKHGEVVLVVTDGKNGLNRHIEESFQFGKGSPLIIKTVAEAEVDIAALVVEVGGTLRKCEHPLSDLIKGLLGIGDQPFRHTFTVVQDPHPKGARRQLLDLIEKRTCLLEEKVMVLGADPVPVTVVTPPATPIWLVDMPFAGKDVVWSHTEVERLDTVEGALERTARVHYPKGTAANYCSKFMGQSWRATISPLSTGKSAVKIGTEKSNRGHEKILNSLSGLSNPQIECLLEESCYSSDMKSAYELALSRLEQSSPTKPLTVEQKRELAEIDSEYDAKIAERRIFLESEIAKSLGDPVGEEQIRRQLASEIATFQEKRDLKKDKIRLGKSE